MDIWLIKEGEPLPCDESPRLMRMGLLAQYLCKKQHNVTWWSSSFEHGKKKNRKESTETIRIFGNGTLILLFSKITYKKNTSPSRLIYHRTLARGFLRIASTMKKPDLIFCAFPTIDFAEAAIKFGKKNSIPVILDVRDLWPDIFVRAIPKPLKFMSSIILSPLQKRTRWIMSKATAITAINPSHLKWSLEKANREKTSLDRSIFIGYQKASLDETERMVAEQFWDNLGITSDTWNLCYVGTMSPMTLDMETVIKGFSLISKNEPDVRLVLCGEGDGLRAFKELALNCPHIVFPGWVDKKQITVLLERSKIGLYPFHNLPDFINSFTNKIIEYFSGGVPVASCLTGFSRDFILSNDVGYVYTEGDANSFCSIVEEAYTDMKKREIKAINAFNSYKQYFTDEMSNQQFDTLFSETVCRET